MAENIGRTPSYARHITQQFIATRQPARDIHVNPNVTQDEMAAEYALVVNVTSLPLVASEPASNVVRYWLLGRDCSEVRYCRKRLTSPAKLVTVLDGRKE